MFIVRQTEENRSHDNVHSSSILRVPVTKFHQTRTVSDDVSGAPPPRQMGEICLQCHCHNHPLLKQTSPTQLAHNRAKQVKVKHAMPPRV